MGDFDTYIPKRRVTLKCNTPSYITPLVKSLLRKRNRMMRQGRLIEAETLSTKIGTLIAEHRSKILSNCKDIKVSELWKLIKPAKSATATSTLSEPDSVNSHFANIATDPNYCATKILDQLTKLQPTSLEKVLQEYEIEKLLSTTKRTSPGIDNIPYWVFRNCSYELASIVTHITNLSLSQGKPPSSWKRAVVTPIPKVTPIAGLTDLRPISVTPILSRIVEKIVVHRFLLPAIPQHVLSDQFAFRPTGSTTCALVYLIHQVTKLLEHNTYVRCLLIDFSKAFDSINHLILLQKLKDLNIPPNIFNWIANFLSGRTQSVKLDGKQSTWLPITQSIVQGSGLGPVLFIIFIAALCTLCDDNQLCKYADDLSLLNPETASIGLNAEFDNIKLWATLNKLSINLSKTKEIIFRRPGIQRPLGHCLPLPGIEQLDSVKLLGVILQSTLTFSNHINYILNIINQRYYLLNQLRQQGLHSSKLDVIFQAIVISRIMYALPAFAGFLTSHDLGRINAALKKARRWQICEKTHTAEELIARADKKLFQKAQFSDHCIHQLLPPHRDDKYQLRKRGHPFMLPFIKSKLFKSSFINRCIFSYI